MDREERFPSAEEIESMNKIEIRELTLRNGLAYPSNTELIMLILGSGTKERPIKELAKDVIEKIMATNLDCLVDALTEIKGMGKTKALIIAAALELGKRINRNPQAYLSTPIDILPYIQNYAIQKKEHFLCVSLSGANEIISIRVICTGAGNMAIVHPSEVFSEAIKEHASAVIISHNHPNGDPKPSVEDIATTLRLCQAADILGITLVDHIILSKNGYYSFLENDYMDCAKLFNLL